MKFRKKPVIIEAIQFYDGGSVDKMQDAWGVPFQRVMNAHQEQDFLFINTLEGAHKANLGDWIIKGVKGEFYPCKPDIFELTYEPADEKLKEAEK